MHAGMTELSLGRLDRQTTFQLYIYIYTHMYAYTHNHTVGPLSESNPCLFEQCSIKLKILQQNNNYISRKLTNYSI